MCFFLRRFYDLPLDLAIHSDSGLIFIIFVFNSTKIIHYYLRFDTFQLKTGLIRNLRDAYFNPILI